MVTTKAKCLPLLLLPKTLNLSSYIECLLSPNMINCLFRNTSSHSLYPTLCFLICSKFPLSHSNSSSLDKNILRFMYLIIQYKDEVCQEVSYFPRSVPTHALLEFQKLHSLLQF